jgi:hypothetical protein
MKQNKEIEFGESIIAVETVSRELLGEAEALFHRNNFDKSFSSWQFSRRFDREIQAITARDDGVLVGFNATMPVTLSISGNTEQDAIWSCDFIVDRKYRGKGLGSSIKQCLKDCFPIPTFALGISDQAMSVLQRSEWKTQVGLNVYNKIIKPENNRQRILFTLGKLSQFFSGKAQFKSETTLKVLPSLPKIDALESLWLKVKTEYGVCIARTGAYIKWRYGDNKALNYQFVATFQQNELVALMVYRYYSDELKIIDYIGPIEDTTEFLKLINSLLNTTNINQINININQPKLSDELTKLGFLRTRYFSNFAYFFKDELLSDYQWTLTAGDSDGELISALKSQGSEPLSVDEKEKYSIKAYSDVSLLPLREDWNRLLEQSTANSLFMSWYWCANWWRTWKETINTVGHTQLDIQLIYHGEKLVGIIPLYYIKKKKLGLCYKEYHFLGNAWHVLPTVRSEYISPILLKKHSVPLQKVFATWFNNKPWNSMLIWPDANVDTFKLDHCFKATVISKDRGIKINTQSQSFEQYKQKLGKNTRLKGVTRQNVLLNAYQNVEWCSYELNAESCALFFNQLNSFHQSRWGKDCFDSLAVKFHLAMLSQYKELDGKLDYLVVDEKVISVVYNLNINGVNYNLQSGFTSEFPKKYSLGTMHLMRCIEDSFSNENINSFDMLAGEGLNEYYKNHYKGDTVNFSTFGIFSNKTCYYLYTLLLKIKKIKEKLTF